MAAHDVTLHKNKINSLALVEHLIKRTRRLKNQLNCWARQQKALPFKFQLNNYLPAFIIRPEPEGIYFKWNSDVAVLQQLLHSHSCSYGVNGRAVLHWASQPHRSSFTFSSISIYVSFFNWCGERVHFTELTALCVSSQMFEKRFLCNSRLLKVIVWDHRKGVGVESRVLVSRLFFLCGLRPLYPSTIITGGHEVICYVTCSLVCVACADSVWRRIVGGQIEKVVLARKTQLHSHTQVVWRVSRLEEKVKGRRVKSGCFPPCQNCRNYKYQNHGALVSW